MIQPITLKKQYTRIRELSRGGYGRTFLLHDDTIDKYYVCKKHAPLNEYDKAEYFTNFLTEIKLLNTAHHLNVVRVYEHYVYKDSCTGFTVMEYINGDTIDIYLNKKPEDINEIFLQTIAGFSHLEQSNILHRDIRPQNIMITNTGIVKIIDLGFGKKALQTEDFNKSISLNWPYTRPPELNQGIYNHQSEIYYVAMLFNELIAKENIKHFKYSQLLESMLVSNLTDREKSFIEIEKKISSNQFLGINFNQAEVETYRDFAYFISHTITEISPEAKYNFDMDDIQAKLEKFYTTVMLEESFPFSYIINIFLEGGYSFDSDYNIGVETLKDFIKLLKSCSLERKMIILHNLHSRLDFISRIQPAKWTVDDDIPF